MIWRIYTSIQRKFHRLPHRCYSMHYYHFYQCFCIRILRHFKMITWVCILIFGQLRMRTCFCIILFSHFRIITCVCILIFRTATVFFSNCLSFNRFFNFVIILICWFSIVLDISNGLFILFISNGSSFYFLVRFYNIWRII